jgi:hypothetical protein
VRLKDEQRERYWQLDRLGRVRLSQHFQFRQFLYSEISAMSGIANLPDDPELAIEVGRKLCDVVLEPIVARYGPIIVRSGFRSSAVNEYGALHGLQCAANKKNYAYHIWDNRDAAGHKGAAACIIVPAVRDALDVEVAVNDLVSFIQALDFHDVGFFKRETAFNIGWHEAPIRKIAR